MLVYTIHYSRLTKHSACYSSRMLSLNELAWRRCDELAADAERLNVAISFAASGTRIIDCGVNAAGGLEAGRWLAEICLADCGRVEISGSAANDSSAPLVTIRTDRPLLACMASQYAGWQITADKYFAMGSGPMRAVSRREPLFEEIDYRDAAVRVVGVLE